MVVYTPLYGTVLDHVIFVLKKIGINNLTVVKEQCQQDGLFQTCPSPNPENEEVYEIATSKYANKNENN